MYTQDYITTTIIKARRQQSDAVGELVSRMFKRIASLFSKNKQ